MDLIKIIEEYIEIGSRYDHLRKLITSAENNYFYAKIEGDTAFSEGEYKLEESYNESAKHSKEAKKAYGTELALLEELLLQLQQNYEEELTIKRSDELISTRNLMLTKQEELENEKRNLENKMNDAKAKGDEAYKKGNIEEELEHNKVSTDYFFEIEKLNTKIDYYGSFAKDIEKHIQKKLK